MDIKRLLRGDFCCGLSASLSLSLIIVLPTCFSDEHVFGVSDHSTVVSVKILFVDNLIACVVID